jgi:hypothetical protein
MAVVHSSESSWTSDELHGVFSVIIVSSVFTLLQMDDLLLIIYFITTVVSVQGKGKAIPVTGRAGP